MWPWRVKNEDNYSKLVEIVTVADVDDEERVGNSSLQIWELTFGQKAKLLVRLWAQGFRSRSVGKILQLEFVQHFTADVLYRLWSWILVEILKLGLAKILNFNFSGDADVWMRFLVHALSRFWRWNVIKIFVWTCDMASKSYFGKMNSTLGSVVPLAMFTF